MNPSLNPYATWTWRWALAGLNVRSHWRQLRWYWQRATRGWADCDTWGMSTYLCEVVIPMLQRLKRTKGTPGAFVPDTYDAAVSDEEAEAVVSQGRVAWHAALDEMIAGFTAAAALDDGPPERFFTERDPALVAAERAAAKAESNGYSTRWVSPLDFDRVGYHVWEDAQRAIQARGMQRFVDHFHSLWD